MKVIEMINMQSNANIVKYCILYIVFPIKSNTTMALVILFWSTMAHTYDNHPMPSYT